MRAADASRSLRTLLAAQSLVPLTTRPNSAVRRVFPEADPLTQALLESYLVWEAGPHAAEVMLERLGELAVDPNDLRACLESEIAAALSPVDAHGPERANLLRRCLNDLAQRSPTPTFAMLERTPAQDAAALVMGLDGMTPFVAKRVLLLLLDIPGMPLDSRLRAALDHVRAIPAGLSLNDASDWLAKPEHHQSIRLADAYELIERWAHTPTAKAGTPTDSSTSTRRATKPKAVPKSPPRERAKKSSNAD